MKAKLTIAISCFLLQACTPPAPPVYLRNYSSSPVDIVIIFHGNIPDSAEREMKLIEGTEIERSLPYKQQIAVQERIDPTALRVTVPAGSSLSFPFFRWRPGGFYDSTTVMLVKDHYLIDTLFHNHDIKYLKKFEVARRLLSYQYFYNYN